MAGTIWNISDVGPGADFTLSLVNLKATKSANAFASGIRSTNPKTAGLLYAEMTGNNIGFRAWAGIADAAATNGSFRANTNGMFGVDNTGSVSLNNTPFGPGLALGFNTARVVSLAVDFTNNRAWVKTDNGNWNGSGTANPATNTGGADISAIVSGGIMLMFQAETINDAATINLGGSAFVYTMPSGFSSWDTQVFPNTAYGSVIS